VRNILEDHKSDSASEALVWQPDVLSFHLLGVHSNLWVLCTSNFDLFVLKIHLLFAFQIFAFARDIISFDIFNNDIAEGFSDLL
jgi:hypothetical protein